MHSPTNVESFKVLRAAAAEKKREPGPSRRRFARAGVDAKCAAVSLPRQLGERNFPGAKSPTASTTARSFKVLRPTEPERERKPKLWPSPSARRPRLCSLRISATHQARFCGGKVHGSSTLVGTPNVQPFPVCDSWTNETFQERRAQRHLRTRKVSKPCGQQQRRKMESRGPTKRRFARAGVSAKCAAISFLQ